MYETYLDSELGWCIVKIRDGIIECYDEGFSSQEEAQDEIDRLETIAAHNYPEIRFW